MKTLIFSTSLLFFGFSSRLHPQSHSADGQENLIVRILFHLKEVQQQQQHLYKVAGRNAHIAIYTSSKPTQTDPYYTLQVGYTSKIRFEVYDNYRVNKKYLSSSDISDHIEIMNTGGDFISLQQWRRENKHPN
jgi:hypothetical protein